MRLTVIILCVFLLATSVWTGTWKDDFDDNNDDGWTRWLNGKWEFIDGQCVITVISNCARSAWGDLTWEDYSVEVRVRTTKRLGYPAIDVRVQDPLNRYIWAFDVANNTLVWYLQVNGNYTKMTQDLAPGDPLKEHLYKVVVSGNQFEGYYDGELIRKWQDNSSTFKTGRVGISICSTGAQATFDDFVVTGDDIRPVQPKSKLTTTWGRLKQ